MAARPANAVSGGFSGSDKKKKGTGLVRRVFMAVWNAKFQQRRVRRIFGNEFRKSDCPRIIFFDNVRRFSSGFKYVLICHCYSLVSRSLILDKF